MLKYVTYILNLMPTIIQLGRDVEPFAKQLIAMVHRDTEPTDAEWTALHAMEKTLRDELQAPLEDEIF